MNKNKILSKIIGESVRRWRQVMDYNQSQIAEELGISTSALCRFEQGKCDNAGILLWCIARGFNIERDFYMNGRSASAFDVVEEVKKE